METTAKTKWVIDPAHTEIQFKARHLVIATVTGSFGKFDGTAFSADEDFSDPVIEFNADVNSINTNQEYRDTHLKSADFFDAANYPTLNFKSTGFKKTGTSEAILTGNLTMRGVTKPVEMKVELGGRIVDPYGNLKAGFELSGKINRKDFGLNWNTLTETGNMVVSDEIRILANVELLKQ
jgi:polyisoprenoid-binding protein YceI